MTVPIARKALKAAIKIKTEADTLQKLIAPSNGDSAMIQSLSNSRGSLDFVIRRLSQIVPNAAFIYPAPGVPVPDWRQNFKPGPSMPNGLPYPSKVGFLKAAPWDWCAECENPAEGCTCPVPVVKR